MLSIETLLVASTSQAIVDYIIKRITEIEIRNKTYTAISHDELWEALRNHKPNYLLIEGTFYREATPIELSGIAKKYKKLKIVAYGFNEYTEKYLKRLFAVGILGYLDVRKGRAAFKKELKSVLSEEKLNVSQLSMLDKSTTDYLESAKLTNRDMEIIHLIFEELDNKEIAETLDIKVQTVRNYRAAIYRKLQVNNTVGLIKTLVEKGLVTIGKSNPRK